MSQEAIVELELAVEDCNLAQQHLLKKVTPLGAAIQLAGSAMTASRCLKMTLSWCPAEEAASALVHLILRIDQRAKLERYC